MLAYNLGINPIERKFSVLNFIRKLCANIVGGGRVFNPFHYFQCRVLLLNWNGDLIFFFKVKLKKIPKFFLMWNIREVVWTFFKGRLVLSSFFRSFSRIARLAFFLLFFEFFVTPTFRKSGFFRVGLAPENWFGIFGLFFLHVK